MIACLIDVRCTARSEVQQSADRDTDAASLPALHASCLACWRCCYFVLLAARLLSCAHACIIISIHVLALPVWRSRWRAARPLLWLSSLFLMPADGRAQKRGHHPHLDAAAITTSPSHHLYAKVWSHLHSTRLIRLWPSAATITTMTTRRTPAASKQRTGKGEVRDERAREVTRSDRWRDLFPACFLLLHVVRTYNNKYLFPPLGSSGQHCETEKAESVLLLLAWLTVAVGARAPRPSD